MSDFVEECRREWKRLHVPDAISNEMAADLTADLNEAAAEGVAPEEVLGNEAFDPRAFAASWARERGVAPPVPEPNRRRLWLVALLVVVAVVVLLAVTGAVVGLLAFAHGSESAVKQAAPVLAKPVARPTFKIPSLIGQRLPAATAGAESAGLSVRVRYQRSRTAPSGTVIAQSPTPGAFAVPGTALVLVVRR